jgi:mono/diheme cytochrome c family protein
LKGEHGHKNSVLGSLLGAGIPLVLLGGVLAGSYWVYTAFRTPGPYPFVEVSASVSKKAKRGAVDASAGAPVKAGAGAVAGGTSGGSGEAAVPPSAGTGSEAKDPPAIAAGGSAEIAATHASVGDGERLYGIYCVACHQAEGHGKVGFAPFIRNRDFLAVASDDFLRTTIMAGRPGTAMVPWTHLKPQEVDSLIMYLRSAEDPNAKLVVREDPTRKHPGDATSGEGLYGQYCAACHGENARGYAEGGPGPAIGNAGFLSAASDDYIFQTVKLGRIGTPMRGFSGSRGLANLSDQEIGDVIAFLRSRGGAAPEVASAGPDPKAGEMHFKANCAACHQQDGKGRPGFAPSIRNRDFLAIASDEFIKKTVHGGRVGTAMVQRPDLSDQVLSDIVAYLRAVPSETSVDVQVDPTKDLAALGDAVPGHGKFAIYCASCHGDAGKGYVAGGSGPAVGLPGFLNAASDDYIYQTLKLGRLGTAMKPFLGSSGLANLNDQDAHDIIAYLRSLNPSGK